jgi:membrane-bound acyltransferase YfiQ involved in biofilm formation
MSFALYLAGFLILIAGISWGLARAGLATVWIVIIDIILLGLGILKGVTRTRSRDLPKDPSG